MKSERQSDGVTSGSHLTNRMAPHPVHPVNNLWTGFKKWESDGLIRVPYQKCQSCLIKEGYLGNFNKGSCEIKILYEGAERGYGGGGRICLKSIQNQINQPWPTQGSEVLF